MIQIGKNNNTALAFAEDDPDVTLVVRYAAFHELSVTILSQFFTDVDTFGSLSAFPAETLSMYFRHLNSLLIDFDDLPDALSDRLLRVSMIQEGLDSDKAGLSVMNQSVSDLKKRAEEKKEYYNTLETLRGLIKMHIQQL